LSEKPRAQARRAKRGRTVKNRIVTNDYVDAALCVLFVLVVVSMVVFSVRSALAGWRSGRPTASARPRYADGGARGMRCC